MKKGLFLFLAVIFLSFSCAGSLWAIPSSNVDGDGYEDISGVAYDYWENTGELMFTRSGNENAYDLTNEISTWLQNNGHSVSSDFTVENTTQNISFYVNDRDNNEAGYDHETLFTGDITDIGGNYLSGTYVVDTSVLSGISFYSVKGANGFAMYYENPEESYGSWSSYDVWDIFGNGAETAISHWTGFNGTPTAPVPEPATMILLGTGLVGLAATSRKKFKKYKK